MLGQTVTVLIDRPLGTYHPKHKDIYYQVNYGYIPGVIAGDGEEQVKFQEQYFKVEIRM